MKLLAIDTSNQTLAVAVCQDEEILGSYTTSVKKNHSLTLMPAIARLMEAVELSPKELDRIVVAQGPGSYTGLRIGVTTAKTIAYAGNKELVGISSLKVLAANCVDVEGLIVPLFDARRNNVYTGAYQFEKGELKTVIADQHISMEAWLNQLKEYQQVYFVGKDTEKFSEMINQGLPSAQINQISEWQLPKGIKLAQLGQKAAPVEAVHSFLPEYLKRVEAEEQWLKNQTSKIEAEDYVEKV